MDVEIRKVYCRVEVLPIPNGTLFASKEFGNSLTREAVLYLKQNGVKAVAEPFGPKGGGYTKLFDIIRQLWSNREIILMILAILGSVRDGFRRVMSHFHNRGRPTISISLKVIVEGNYDGWEYAFPPLAQTMTGLKVAADDLRERLLKKYPLFRFDEYLGVSINQRSWRSNLYMKHRQIGRLNNARAIHQCETLRVGTDIDQRFSFTILGLVERNEYPTKYSSAGHWSSSSRAKRYFTAISTQIWEDRSRK